ncbi:MAG: type IV pilus modification protein PilV [Burkholderiaceae bacterium]|jgi:type IV pilus assembly protein PilV|nr:type IV pilus modification protein PilV [Burkholderiaceae bacterium]
MNLNFKPHHAQQGSSLIEVLVTLVILMLGLLGLVGLMLQSQRSQMESYQRVQALVVLHDMVNRINANRKVAGCYAVTTDADGLLFLGTDSEVTPACLLGTAAQNARAVQDMTEWNDLLLGSTEQSGGSNTGGMLGARGCVSLVSPGVYQVSVVWQGNGKTVVPAGVSCATDLYGDDAQRRAVTAPLQIATLS